MHLYADFCKSILLSEWFSRSVIRICEVMLIHHLRSAGIHALFSVLIASRLTPIVSVNRSL